MSFLEKVPISNEDQKILRRVTPRWMQKIASAKSWADLEKKQIVVGQLLDLDEHSECIVGEATGFDEDWDIDYVTQDKEFEMYGMDIARIVWEGTKMEKICNIHKKEEAEKALSQINSKFALIINKFVRKMEKEYSEIIKQADEEYAQVRKQIQKENIGHKNIYNNI